MRCKVRVEVFPVMRTLAHAGSVREWVQPRVIRLGAGVPGPQAPVRVLRVLPVRVLRGRVRGRRIRLPQAGTLSASLAAHWRR